MSARKKEKRGDGAAKSLRARIEELSWDSVHEAHDVIEDLCREVRQEAESKKEKPLRVEWWVECKGQGEAWVPKFRERTREVAEYGAEHWNTISNGEHRAVRIEVYAARPKK